MLAHQHHTDRRTATEVPHEAPNGAEHHAGHGSTTTSTSRACRWLARYSAVVFFWAGWPFLAGGWQDSRAAAPE